MGSLRFLALFALLLSSFFAVSANTSNDATHAKDEVKPSEATDAIEPQQRGRGGCRYGCCGSFGFGRCSACCSQPQAAKAEANSQPQATEAEAEAEASSQPQVSEDEANDVVVEPQQMWGGGCRYGCCGGWRYGRCNYCCSRPQVEADVVVVEPQQGGRGGGGCRYGCCGGWRYGRCNYCCSRPQVEADVVEPQQRGGCWFGCCGSYANGVCSACCTKKMATKEEKKKGEAKP